MARRRRAFQIRSIPRTTKSRKKSGLPRSKPMLTSPYTSISILDTPSPGIIPAPPKLNTPSKLPSSRVISPYILSFCPSQKLLRTPQMLSLLLESQKFLNTMLFTPLSPGTRNKTLNLSMRPSAYPTSLRQSNTMSLISERFPCSSQYSMTPFEIRLSNAPYPAQKNSQAHKTCVISEKKRNEIRAIHNKSYLKILFLFFRIYKLILE